MTVEAINSEKNLSEVKSSEVNVDFVDLSNALLNQMQMIAFNNKLFLKLA